MESVLAVIQLYKSFMHKLPLESTQQVINLQLLGYSSNRYRLLINQNFYSVPRK